MFDQKRISEDIISIIRGSSTKTTTNRHKLILHQQKQILPIIGKSNNLETTHQKHQDNELLSKQQVTNITASKHNQRITTGSEMLLTAQLINCHDDQQQQQQQLQHRWKRRRPPSSEQHQQLLKTNENFKRQSCSSGGRSRWSLLFARNNLALLAIVMLLCAVQLTQTQAEKQQQQKHRRSTSTRSSSSGEF